MDINKFQHTQKKERKLTNMLKTESLTYSQTISESQTFRQKDINNKYRHAKQMRETDRQNRHRQT